MSAKQRLAELGEPFVFEHKPSEVNYGGGNRFHQAAFPPLDGDSGGFEMPVFNALQRFVQIVHDPAAGATEPWVWREPSLSDCFFDQWCATPRLSPSAFQHWFEHEVASVAEAYKRLRIQALRQERELDIPGLNAWMATAAVLLIADMLHEYLEKNIGLDHGTAWQSRLTLSRVLSLALTQTEHSAEMARWRKEKFGNPEPDPGVIRLLNPWMLAWAGRPEELTPERMLEGLNPHRLSPRTHATWLEFFEMFFESSRWFECPRLASCLAEPENFQTLWNHRTERKRLLRWIRKEKIFRERFLLEHTCEGLRTWFRDHLGAGADAECAGAIGPERFLEELLADPAARRRFLRHLKLKHRTLVKPAREQLREAGRFMRRARSQWFGRLSREQLSEALRESLLRWTSFLAQYSDFQMLRTRYAHHALDAQGWVGLKLWRGHELNYADVPGGAQDRLSCVSVWPRIQPDIANAFAEGNLFLFRAQGAIYPGTEERRMRSAFLFADLRNSTETTMKLTKDTASFLTPYLTAVDTEAQACRGERIYFAGDGYAAHYHQAADSIRAAYNLAGRFIQLRSQSADEHRRKVKSMYQEAAALKVSWQKPHALAKELEALRGKSMSQEVRAALGAIAALDVPMITEETLVRIFVKTADDFCMPRVDVGVGITCGELFLAMVGAEGTPKSPIVISPALTQAARLSGSSDLVKKHIEENLPKPFPFHAHAWDQKLFNRGIVITDEVFEKLQAEVHIKAIRHSEARFADAKFLYFYDTRLNKRIILRDIPETIFLKGISKPCHIYEVILPYSIIDKLFGTSEE